jgi:periplasmic divalent cation tolerance protein
VADGVAEMTDKIVVLCTCESSDEAALVARGLVEKRLAACVNIVGGARSIYRWKDAIEDSAEWLLVIKTRRELFLSVREEIQRLHSYEVPEVIALPVVDGSESYLAWIDKSLHREVVQGTD